MEFINLDLLDKELPKIKADFFSKKPFHFVTFENLFYTEQAEIIYNNYPSIQEGMWDGKTYIDQKNKFQKTTFDKDSILERVFKELNANEFLERISAITGIEELLGDDELFGGGLHQSVKGAFLNVHVDYNIHPKTKFHRRLNVIVYMNKDWKDEYEGHLELWDFSDGKKDLLAKVAPVFNRCVIFETNEISFHGHPTPLKTPEGMNRKSIATYYYTKTRPAHEIVEDHNTIYKNTQGVNGVFKRFFSGIKALAERMKK